MHIDVPQAREGLQRLNVGQRVVGQVQLSQSCGPCRQARHALVRYLAAAEVERREGRQAGQRRQAGVVDTCAAIDVQPAQGVQGASPVQQLGRPR